ncbi:MAG: response regulator transcription factor [Anaerolineae bacterium]|nr:response regulator transcription factor [Gloeobacterales cyanobacterium ES-bin-313]
MIQVLVAATSAILQAGLEALIQTSPHLQLVSSTRDLTQAINILKPDVVLVAQDGQEDEMLDAWNGSSLILLSDHWAPEVLRAGVKAILPLDSSASEIVAAVEAVAAGLIVLHSDFSERFFQNVPSTRSIPTQTLTPREVEVLRMLAEGTGNKTIASRLGISEHTVKFHIGSIFSKLGVSNRTEAVTLGVRQGLILL